MCDLATGLPWGMRNASHQASDLLLQTLARTQRPMLLRTTPQHRQVSKSCLLLGNHSCHVKNPSLAQYHESVDARGSTGHCCPSEHLWVSVSAGAKLSCGSALWGSGGVQVGLSLAYIFLHYQICVFKSSILRCLQKNNTTPLLCSGCLLRTLKISVK